MVQHNLTTLHLHYDLEKPGYDGYERRHYPEKYRFDFSESIYKPRGRAHVPSPPLEEIQWRPHGQHIEPHYSNVGPDWHSRIRYIPAPCDPDGKPTLPVAVIERNFHFMRSFPQNWQRTTNEWLYFNDQSPNARSLKRNFFENIHLRSLEDLGDENIQMQQIGRKKRVYSMRNGLPKRSDGDKSYRQVEYSPDFHKLGCTLPAVDFGRMKKHHGPMKTIVQMTDEIIPVIDENDFELKEQQREQAELIHDVIELDNWKPVETMTPAFNVFGTNLNDKNPIKYRSRLR